MRKSLHLFIVLFFVLSSSLKGQIREVFSDIREGDFVLSYLHKCHFKDLTNDIAYNLNKELGDLKINPTDDNEILIGHQIILLSNTGKNLVYKSSDRTETIFIHSQSSEKQIDSLWKIIKKLISPYSGYNPSGHAFYYLKLDSFINTSLNYTFRSKNTIVNIQKVLPFTTPGFEFTETERGLIRNAHNHLLNIMAILNRNFVYKIEQREFPLNGKHLGRPFASSERLAGFTQFWTEVKYNFAFFDQVPELNWDEVLLDYLPRVQADQTNAEYYKLMQELCAKLKDGHTNVYLPPDMQFQNYSPNIELSNFGNKIHVVNTSRKYENMIPLGSEITKVNNQKVQEYISNELVPYISSSTDHIKQKIASQELLNIPLDQKMSIEFISPKGQAKIMTFSNEEDTTDWIISRDYFKILDFKKINKDIALLSLNSFHDEDIIADFLKVKDSIKSCKKLIIDLRSNGGGNSDYGTEILKYFATKPFLTSKWKTREHKASFKAWGQLADANSKDPSEIESFKTNKGDYWYEGLPDTIVPYYDQHISIPIVILIGNNTASAAEDFLISADNIGMLETVGDVTFGSTGQPMTIKLPGGGRARICTKKDTYPDGREFVGYGIKPKYVVKPTIQDVINKKDVVLDFAVRLN